MKMKPNMEKKIEDTLNSLDGIQRAEPEAFFYTRLRGRMQRDERSIWERTGAFLARPVVVAAGLCTIFVLNAFILLYKDTKPSAPATANTIEQIVTDNEYILASNSSFDYETSLSNE